MHLTNVRYLQRGAPGARFASVTASEIQASHYCRANCPARLASSKPSLHLWQRLRMASAACASTKGNASPLATDASAPSGPSESAVAEPDQPEPAADVCVQYVVLRRDLWRDLGWPLGSVIAQACHASTAAIWQSRWEADTKAYCASIDSMTKVVLEVKGEAQLRTLAGKLTYSGIGHKLWTEQPEDFVTCLATHPAQRSKVAHHFKKLNLCKGTP